MLRVININKTYGTTAVLTDVSFTVAHGEKAALVGMNGAGKSTLMKILAGIEDPDSGTIEMPKNASIGYLPQDMSLVTEQTVIKYLKQISGIDVLEKKLEELSSDLADPATLAEYGKVQSEYEHVDGYSFLHKAKVMLKGFGFSEDSAQKRLIDLSSGQKSKVMLIGILLKGIDFLLLDEPTNNLDLPSLIWLENFLRKSDVPSVIVSHDRRFLDKVANKVIEIDWMTRSVKVTGGKYSDYLDMALKQLENTKVQYRQQQDEIARLKGEAQKQRADMAKGAKWKGSDNDKMLRGFKQDKSAKSGRKAKVLEKRIEQMEMIEKPFERDPLEILLESSKGNGSLHIVLEDVTAGYANGFRIGPLSLNIQYGNRVGIMGLNGSGKSTLLKTLTKMIPPLEGKVEIGSGVRIGNLMQEHELLPKGKTPVQFLEENTDLEEEFGYALPVKFGLSRTQCRQPIATLSPGGRARLILAYFAANSVNALILDEPTNHLDMEAVQALEDALSSYPGTVILVTHDRYFLEKAKLDFVYQIMEGKLSRIPDYKAYLESAEKRAEGLLKTL